MKISIIAALAENHLIGVNGKLPWQLPADLKHFNELTMGEPVIMGRKTYQSLGKALPGRRNILLTTDKNAVYPDCETYDSLAKALQAVKDCEEVMILGGTEVYKEAMDIADTMYLTIIHHRFEGDTYFPTWDADKWQETSREDCDADPDNPYPYSFVTLTRI